MHTITITTTLGPVLINYDITLLAGDRKDKQKQHDDFFGKFTNSWLPLIQQERYKDAEKVWAKALEITATYEAENKNSIHKGTPYYFWGMTCILSGDLDMGFHLMHQALEEDKRNSKATGASFKGTPAYAFVKMDYSNQNQASLPKVKEVAAFVEGMLRCYRISRAGTLDIVGLRTKVLENDDLGDVPFFFVYNSFRLKKFLDAEKEIRQNDFASLLQSQTIFGFCIVAEELLRNLWIKQESKGKNEKPGWPVYLNVFASQKHLPNLTQKTAAQTNIKFKNDFCATLSALLDSTYVYENGRKPSPIEEDLLILYGFRNSGAHDLNSKELVYKNFEVISQRVLNALFFII